MVMTVPISNSVPASTPIIVRFVLPMEASVTKHCKAELLLDMALKHLVTEAISAHMAMEPTSAHLVTVAISAHLVTETISAHLATETISAHLATEPTSAHLAMEPTSALLVTVATNEHLVMEATSELQVMAATNEVLATDCASKHAHSLLATEVARISMAAVVNTSSSKHAMLLLKRPPTELIRDLLDMAPSTRLRNQPVHDTFIPTMEGRTVTTCLRPRHTNILITNGERLTD